MKNLYTKHSLNACAFFVTILRRKKSSSPIFSSFLFISFLIITVTASSQNKKRIPESQPGIVAGQSFQQVRHLSNGMAAVMKNDKWGFVNEQGVLAVDCLYDLVADFRASVTAVQKQNNWFLIDKSGAVIKQLDIDFFFGYQNGVAKIMKRGRSNFIDESGNLVNGSSWRTEAQVPAKAATHRTHSTYVCPDNIDFEFGNFTNWNCFTGFVDTSGPPPTTNVITVNPSAPTPNRHTIVPRTIPSVLDPFGLFPINPPDGSNFCVRLGNPINGFQAERIQYVINVPLTATNFNIVYQYAVVFQDPGHPQYAQPRFTAKVFDPVTNSYLPCASFEYVADSTLPGFSLSTVANDVWFKPWAAVFMNLSAYAGKTIYLEFTTADCARGAHWGYAYVDVNQCDDMIKAQNTCTAPPSTVLSGPPGFQTYNWYDSSYTTLLGTGQILTLNPGLAVNTTVHLQVIPFNMTGCTDTLHTTVTFSPPVVTPSPDKNICRGNSTSIGAAPLTDYTYSWSPNYYLSSTNNSSVTANPPDTTVYYLTVTDTLTGCTAFDTVAVNVTPVDTAISLNGAGSFCAGGNVILQAGVASSYQWLLNNTVIAGATSSTYTATQAGSYSVIVGNAQGCSDTTRSIPVVVYPKPVADFTVTNPNQCFSGNNFTIVNNSSVSSGTISYYWTFGDGATSTAANPSHQYAAAGNYSIKLVVTSNQGCKDSVQVPVNVYDDPTVNITPGSPASFCPGGSVMLTANASVSNGSVTGYQWYNNNVIITGAINTTLTVTAAGNYSVLVTTNNNCGKQSAVIPVTLYPKPLAAFTIANTQQCLTANSFVFTDASSPNGGGPLSYSWTFGDGGISTQANPVYHYNNPGTYNVYHYVTNTNGCKDTANSPVTVYNEPVLNLSPNGATSFCAGDSTTLTVAASVAGGSITSYQWYNNNTLIAGATNSTLVVHASGNYSVEVLSSNNCIKRSSSVQVTVNPLPIGHITSQSSNFICEGNTSLLIASGGNAYQWFLNNLAMEAANNDSLSVTVAGIYSVVVTSLQGCKNKAADTVSLTVIKKPKPLFDFSPFCKGIPVQFDNLSDTTGSGLVTWKWNFGDNDSSLVYEPVHTFNNGGTYMVTFILSPAHCPSLQTAITHPIQIEEPVAGVRYRSINAMKFDYTQLHARDIGVTYEWSPSSGLTNANIKDPLFFYDREVEYLISITTRAGCNTVDTQLVRTFEECGLYVPNAFSPNGDGKNDEFYPFLVGIRDFKYFRVYDRWGQLMFMTNEREKGWNGIYKGKQAPMDTYTWIVEGVCADGRLIKKSGNAILLR